MNLDDRAHRAAADLRHRAGRVLDVEGALDAVVTGSVAPMPRGRLLVTSAVAVAVLALVGGLVLLSGRGSEDARPPDVTPAPESTAIDERTPEQILELLPAGPIDGKESQKLPVVAVPQSAVVDGQVLTVLGKGFVPDERVGIVMCASEAAVEGVNACDLGVEFDSFRYVNYATASSEGSIIAEVVVRQVITTPVTGPVDCLSAAERCLLAIGAVSDYDRSGGSFIGFAGAPPFPQPTLVVEPPGPYLPGQVVAVRATGMLAPRQAQVLQCRDDRCVVLHRGEVAADGTYAVDVAIEPVFVGEDGLEVVCEDVCVLRVDGIGVQGATSAPMPPPVPLTFGITEPVPSTAPVPTGPVVTEPLPTGPVPTEPVPTAPVPTEPVPTEPVPTEPVPTEVIVEATAPGT